MKTESPQADHAIPQALKQSTAKPNDRPLNPATRPHSNDTDIDLAARLRDHESHGLAGGRLRDYETREVAIPTLIARIGSGDQGGVLLAASRREAQG